MASPFSFAQRDCQEYRAFGDGGYGKYSQTFQQNPHLSQGSLPQSKGTRRGDSPQYFSFESEASASQAGPWNFDPALLELSPCTQLGWEGGAQFCLQGALASPTFSNKRVKLQRRQAYQRRHREKEQDAAPGRASLDCQETSGISETATGAAFEEVCKAIQEGQQDDVERAVLRLEETLPKDWERGPRTVASFMTEHLLQAVADPDAVLDQGTMRSLCLHHRHTMGQEKGSPILINCANVTSWRRAVLDWHVQTHGQVLLVQETHLWGQKHMEFGIDAYKAGFHHFGGAGSEPDPRPKGGVAVLVPRHSHAREVEQFSIQGCGYVAVELPRVKWRLLVVSLYLQVDCGLHLEPNSTILAHLLVLLRQHRNYIVAGDWNTPYEDIQATSLETAAKGVFISGNQATTTGGSVIDYALVSRGVSGLVSLATSWEVPFGTHASLQLTVDVAQGQLNTPQLKGHPNRLCQLGALSQPSPLWTPTPPLPLNIAGVELGDHPLTQAFAEFSRQMEQEVYGSVTGRGFSNPVVFRPLMQAKVPRSWFGAAAANWNRILAGLRGPSPAQGLFQEGLNLWDDSVDRLEWTRAHQLGDWDQARRLALQQQDLAEKWGRAKSSEDYQAWLQLSSVGGLRPLFRALKKEETLVTRPFKEQEYPLRMPLRILQWAPLWRARSEPRPVDQELLSRSTQQAAQLPPVTGRQLHDRFKSMVVKAPGPDGWEAGFLKALTVEQCQQLADINRRVELGGTAPMQWQIALITLLPKNEVIERPIALIPIPQKISIKSRWHLAEDWLETHLHRFWWDSAVPGKCTLDVSLKRLMSFENAKAGGEHRITLFLDLSTFYEAVDLEALVHTATQLQFPPLLLHSALRSYLGARVLTCEEAVSPPLYARRGLLAGCPLAPMLSKLALFAPLSGVLNSNKSVEGADVWIDDISVDTQDKSAGRAAKHARLLLSRLTQALKTEGHTVSNSKTFFIASSAVAAKALQQILEKGDPEVRTVGADLGVTNSGARKRHTGGTSRRIGKANRRLSKLRKLRIPSQKVRTRLFNASILTSGLWGHQGQGICPKLRRSLRSQAAQIGGRQPQGSIDITLAMADAGVKDPEVGIITQHWAAVAKVLLGTGVGWVRRTWQVLWGRLQGKHRWKRVTGPLGAMVCYFKDLGIDASDPQKWQYSSPGNGTREQVHLSFEEPSSAFEGRLVLLQAIQDSRMQVLAKQLQCPAAQWGLDFTVAKNLLKRFKGKPKATFLKSIWQGCFNIATSQGGYICGLCNVASSQEHSLVDCQWWASNNAQKPDWWRKEHADTPLLWDRGFIPSSVSKHPEYLHGRASLTRTGVFASGQPVPTEGLVFATDASGGARSADTRLRITTWSVVAAVLVDGMPQEVGHLTGVCAPGTSIPTGESMALNFCLDNTVGPVDVTADCQPAKKQAESKTMRAQHWPAWFKWDQRSRLSITWIRSHTSLEKFDAEFGTHNRWRRELNCLADKYCGQLAQSILDRDHVAKVDSLDELSRRISLFLADRAEILLKSGRGPDLLQTKDRSVKFCKKRKDGPKPKQLNQHRPADDGGLNKLERLRLLEQDQSKGHNWQWRGSKLPSLSCSKCSLYIKQIMDLKTFDLIERHPCRHWEAEWNPALPPVPTHHMHNLGHVWICKKCFGTHKVSAKALSGKLLATCTGTCKEVPQAAKLIPQDPRQTRFGTQTGEGRQSGVASFAFPQEVVAAAALSSQALGGTPSSPRVGRPTQEQGAAPKAKAKPKAKPKARGQQGGGNPSQKITSFFKA